MFTVLSKNATGHHFVKTKELKVKRTTGSTTVLDEMEGPEELRSKNSKDQIYKWILIG